MQPVQACAFQMVQFVAFLALLLLEVMADPVEKEAHGLGNQVGWNGS